MTDEERERLQPLLAELGQLIHEAVDKESGEGGRIYRQLSKIREAGFNVFVTLDATIALSTNDQAAPENAICMNDATIPEFSPNNKDALAMRALGIDIRRRGPSENKRT